MITDNTYEQLKAPSKWNFEKFYESHLREESPSDPQYYIRFDHPTEADRFWIDDLGYESKCTTSGSLYLRFGNEATRDDVVKELEDRGVENFSVGEGTRQDFINYYRGLNEKSSLKEARETDLKVPFEIGISPRGAIGKATMMKVFKYILKEIPNSSRINRTYYITDPTGRMTCWWLEKNNYGELELSCELTEEETEVEKDRYNCLILDYDRSTKKYMAEYESHFVERKKLQYFKTFREKSKNNIQITNIFLDDYEVDELEKDRAKGTLTLKVTFKHLPTNKEWTDTFKADAVGVPHGYYHINSRNYLRNGDPGYPEETEYEDISWDFIEGKLDSDEIFTNAPKAIKDLSDEDYEALAYEVADMVEDTIQEHEQEILENGEYKNA